MPCYLFTYHTYGTWLPDRRKGYVVRKRGILPPDERAAQEYRRDMRQRPVLLDGEEQRVVIDTLGQAASHLSCRPHAIATEPTHVHTLVSWRDDERQWLPTRTSLKRAITLRLKQEFGGSVWLSEGSSRKRVHDDDHFRYLVTRYLPSHSGWKWDEQRGLYQ